MDIIVSLLLHTSAFAAVLYLISVGLSVTMGLMGFANLAHGVFAMLGGYLTASLITAGGLPWVLAVPAAALFVAAIAVPVERILYAQLYRRQELDQVLFSIGLIFVASGLAQQAFGPLLVPVPVPGPFLDPLTLLGVATTPYKLLLVVTGLGVAALVLGSLETTTLGAKLRAAVENRTMAEGLGLNTSRLFTCTFALGSGLAALGGALGAELFPITPAYGLIYLVYFMIVVAIAGLGTVRGALIASYAVAFISTASAYLAPEFGTILLFLTVFVFLRLRPRGLFGRV